MSILEIHNLTKTYGMEGNTVIALENISFNVQRGEFVAIVGQSGSGKSTLIHLIGGIDKPDSGNVLIDDVNLFSLKEEKLVELRRQKIGLIYQFYNLVPILNVEENIVLPIKLDNKKVDKKELEFMLQLLGLAERRKHFPNQLSGGQQQRTAIARALLMNPSIILADEPTGNLDSKNSGEIIDYFKLLNEEYGQTIILITHDEHIAMQAKRIITISDGKIIGDKPVV